VVRQQLSAIHKNFEVFDEIGAMAMSVHGSGLRVMDRIEVRDGSGTPVPEVEQRPGVRPHVDLLTIQGKHRVEPVQARSIGAVVSQKWGSEQSSLERRLFKGLAGTDT